MKTFKRGAIVVSMALALVLSGCAAKSASAVAPTQTAQQKFVKANNILATATASAVSVTADLGTSGVLTVAQTNEIMSYESQVATVTDSISKILALPGTWQEQLPQIVAIVAKLPPSQIIERYLKMNDVQYAALVAALQGVVSTVQVVALEAQQ